MRLRLGVLTASLLFGAALPAQQSALPATLSVATRDTLQRLVDSVRAAGLPSEPLVAKASEGVLKQVPEERIVWAVRALVRRQAEARAALPATVSPGTLAAAVSALQAGMSPQTLRRLASVRRSDETALAIACIAVADLVATRVSAEAAASAIEELLRRGASEQVMTGFRQGVVEDIRAGRAPDAALSSQRKAFARYP
jgi:hypothetical protein